MALSAPIGEHATTATAATIPARTIENARTMEAGCLTYEIAPERITGPVGRPVGEPPAGSTEIASTAPLRS